MRYDRRLEVPGDEAGVIEAVRAFFVGEGYADEGRGVSGALAFAKATRGLGLFAMRIEDVPTRVIVHIAERDADDADDEPRVRLLVSYRVRARLRIVTRIDYLFFRLETEGLQDYLISGLRRPAGQRLTPLRRPVSTAVIVNAGMSSVLIGVVGALAGLSPPVLVATAIVVALINMISIMGFADVVVEGMENLD